MGILFVRNPKGQGLIEYVILVALVAVASMGIVRVLQHTVKINMANTIHALQGDKKRKESFERVEKSDLEKADFSNFMNGAAARQND